MEANFGIGLVMIPVVLFIFMLPIALLVALQVWLGKRSPKMGLILPGVSLALSLLLTLSMASFSTLTVRAGNTLVSPVEGGAYTESPAQEGVAVQEKTEFHPEALVVAGVLFLVGNIPTAVFGGIWLHYKGQKDTSEALKKMRIEDLG